MEAGAKGERCARCWASDGSDRISPGDQDTHVVAKQVLGWRELPQSGDRLGPYRIVRRLGQGGMGAVFEAEEVDSGRRIALKTLDRAFDSPDARARFLREGRLAASINHPNSVYVYGTGEIETRPVIAMELMAGGTLEDEVVRQGPWPAERAVDAVLQVVNGLEAAQRQGILHRDVKPSNCFIDGDGAVKIGDFGLSISLAADRESSLTTSGAFIGTPAFSSPEQLRGQELTVRSDIYAVGLTLYYLLTGRLPFEGPNPVQLLATILERAPESPASFRAELPHGLCQVVLRCLEKDPAQRFRDYASLREALRMYASAAPIPAPLGLRTVAGLVDTFLLGSLQLLSTTLWLGGWQEMVRLDVFEHPALAYALLTNWAGVTVYFGLLEGLRGASLGKQLCGLRVRQSKVGSARVHQACWRGWIFAGVSVLPQLLFWGLCRGAMLADPQQWSTAASLMPALFTLLLFVTARRSNGFAALHDLATRTRVVLPAGGLPSGTPILQAKPPINTEGLPRLGPYQVVETLAQEPGRALVAGYDSRLHRAVWIHRQPTSTPPVSTACRQLSRPGRLRWLGGQRTSEVAWDAYEHVGGAPFLERIRARPDWEVVRHWLLDLAVELQAAQQDGSLSPPLTLDRIWITEDERARILDFPIPGQGAKADLPHGPEPVCVPLRFLGRVVGSALVGRVSELAAALQSSERAPLPLHARSLLLDWESGLGLGDLLRQLRAVLHHPAALNRARRLAVWSGSALIPVLGLVLGMGGVTVLKRMNQRHPEYAVLRECLQARGSVEEAQIRGGGEGVEATRDNFEIFVASRFGAVITNAELWNSWVGTTTLTASQRRQAEGFVARWAEASAEEVARAEAEVEAWFKMPAERYALNQINQIRPLTIGLGVCYVCTLVLAVLPCWVASVLFRGGVLFLLSGTAVVLSDGRPASRRRVLWRSVIAWSPFVGFPLVAMGTVPPNWLPGVTLGAFIALGIVTLIPALLPARGVPDRLAGTDWVPK